MSVCDKCGERKISLFDKVVTVGVLIFVFCIGWVVRQSLGIYSILRYANLGLTIHELTFVMGLTIAFLAMVICILSIINSIIEERAKRNLAP